MSAEAVLIGAFFLLAAVVGFLGLQVDALKRRLTLLEGHQHVPPKPLTIEHPMPQERFNELLRMALIHPEIQARLQFGGPKIHGATTEDVRLIAENVIADAAKSMSASIQEAVLTKMRGEIPVAIDRDLALRRMKQAAETLAAKGKEKVRPIRRKR